MHPAAKLDAFQREYNTERPHERSSIKPPWGTLNAIDLNSGETKWSIPFGEYPKLVA